MISIHIALFFLSLSPSPAATPPPTPQLTHTYKHTIHARRTHHPSVNPSRCNMQSPPAICPVKRLTQGNQKMKSETESAVYSSSMRISCFSTRMEGKRHAIFSWHCIKSVTECLFCKYGWKMREATIKREVICISKRAGWGGGWGGGRWGGGGLLTFSSFL